MTSPTLCLTIIIIFIIERSSRVHKTRYLRFVPHLFNGWMEPKPVGRAISYAADISRYLPFIWQAKKTANPFDFCLCFGHLTDKSPGSLNALSCRPPRTMEPEIQNSTNTDFQKTIGLSKSDPKSWKLSNITNKITTIRVNVWCHRLTKRVWHRLSHEQVDTCRIATRVDFLWSL